MRVKLLLITFLVALLISGCANSKTQETTVTNETINLSLLTLNKVQITAASPDDLGSFSEKKPCEIYTISDPALLDALSISVDSVVKSSSKPENILYHAAFYLESGKPMETWFDFPDKIWLKGSTGEYQCYDVEGDFANLIAKELVNVPRKFKGEIGLNTITQEPVLFTPEKPYNLYLSPIDLQKVNSAKGNAVVIIGKTFVKDNIDYIEALAVEGNKPSITTVGKLGMWVNDNDFTISTAAGKSYILKVDRYLKKDLKQQLGKNIKVTGFVFGPDANYTNPYIDVCYFKFL